MSTKMWKIYLLKAKTEAVTQYQRVLLLTHCQARPILYRMSFWDALQICIVLSIDSKDSDGS